MRYNVCELRIMILDLLRTTGFLSFVYFWIKLFHQFVTVQVSSKLFNLKHYKKLEIKGTQSITFYYILKPISIKE